MRIDVSQSSSPAPQELPLSQRGSLSTVSRRYRSVIPCLRRGTQGVVASPCRGEPCLLRSMPEREQKNSPRAKHGGRFFHSVVRSFFPQPFCLAFSLIISAVCKLTRFCCNPPCSLRLFFRSLCKVVHWSVLLRFNLQTAKIERHFAHLLLLFCGDLISFPIPLRWRTFPSAFLSCALEYTPVR